MAILANFALLLILATLTLAQENADTNIAKSLRECYNNTEYIDANMKRPMTMNYLIDLIRKVENGRDRLDIQKLSTSLLHRFRQDGVLRAPNIRDSSILPFSPYGDENKKFKILLKNIVPNSYLFPNDTLSPIERCTLHLMLSESVETLERGDESKVCSKTGKYRMRTRRNVDLPPDVEILESSIKQPHKGNIQLNPDDQVGTINSRKHTSDPAKPESLCPLEYGVVYTKWGAVSAGSVIAGIAAGTEPQEINIKQNFETEMDGTLDSVWGATLAGNIAEAAYFSRGNSRDIKIGAEGGWYSTQAPHGYYLTKSDDYFFTDAEIRGDLDGLILGTKMKEYRRSSRNLKLSQLLDMYYSERGLFNENIKACRRNELLTEYAKTADVEKQGLAFALILNKKITLQTTMDEVAVLGAIKEAANKFGTYVPSNIRDFPCLNNDDRVTVRTEIMIVLDFSWQFETAEAMLTRLLDNIDINPYNSNYTLINAQTGQIITNSSNSLTDLAEIFNQTFYDTQSKGFDLRSSMSAVETVAAGKIELERLSKEPASRSFIALFIANGPSIAGNQKEFVINRLNEHIRPNYPDLRFLGLTSGPKEVFVNIVKDTSRDVIQIQDTSNSDNIVSNVGQLVTRIKEIPSRIISYKCTVNWTSEGDDKTITEYVEPKTINYYRVASNYFFSGESNRIVKIRGQGQSVLSVCHSRDVELPRTNGGSSANSTQQSEGSSGPKCQQVTNEEVTIELKDPCYDYYLINECPPLYFSVEAKESRTGSSDVCTDKNCRYTDNVKFTISTENFGCYSNANVLIINVFVFIISMLFVTFVKNINN